ncbi:pirin family protein [Sediminitomix flava]|uniref:Pirin family protein n=1 Tax=Sediminitomix flava TaxID=379075 RepID=A0A315YX76_SEDFL|nr:pirin family protein [Sediminitomix flava]PWJ34176.1 hypothetical protein BC781_11186 [Sediminitomix flava]
MKKITAHRKSSKVNMGGIILDQPLPTATIDQVDPFLLIHHWKDRLPGNQLQKNVGVGVHPHRGFSPVTFIFKGAVHHKDSEGNDEIVTEGGVQWMFAGRGIMHSERPPAYLAEEGGDFEIIQLWVNVPAKYKMDNPSYQPVKTEDMPRFISDDEKVKIDVVAGQFNEIEGKIEHPSPLNVFRLDMDTDGEVELDVPEGYQALMYILDGELEVNEYVVGKGKEMFVFAEEGKNVTLKANQETRTIFLAAPPINEEVATYGPFVMNTESEVMQALRDAQMGKMGVLLEE